MVTATIPGITMKEVRVEVLECIRDLPNCPPYTDTDWYLVAYLYGRDTTMVSGDDLHNIQEENQ